MAHEIELKYKVEAFDVVERALRAAGAEFVCTVVLTDRYYDTPDRDLLKQDCGARIRTWESVQGKEGAKDPRPQLTYKSPGDPDSRAKVRRELQTRIDDADILDEIFRNFGLEVTLSIEKRRTTWRLDECTIELDELPLIGCFVEIEAPSADAIDAMAERLGLTGAPSKDHYINLLLAACDRLGTRCRHVRLTGCRNGPAPGCAGQ